MSLPQWLTPAGDLGIISEGIYYQFQLDAYDTGGDTLTYTKIAGTLPSGIQVTKAGSLQGIPVVLNGADGVKNFANTFTVRAQNTQGKVADRTFTLTISNIVPPDITPESSSLGTFLDGTFINIQLNAIEINPEAPLQWSIAQGALPPNLSINPSTGLISGYLFQTPLPTDAGNGGWDLTQWDKYYWDFLSRNEDVTYSFTVQVFDGINYDKVKYTITVLAKSALTADNDIELVNNTFVGVDVDNLHNPILLTAPGDLPTIRQNSNFAFQFTGVDFDGDTINFGTTTGGVGGFDQSPFDTVLFDQGDLSLPPGLMLDPVTGWLTGRVGTINANSQTFTFKVYVFKQDKPTYQSQEVTFNLTILGDVNNAITWVTAADLGSIENGSISEFQIVASSPSVSLLHYKLKSGSNSRLPQGLQLFDNGLISGRVSFEHFTLDAGATTFDGGDTSFDSVYTFTVTAFDTQNTTSADQTFTIRVVNRNDIPYENLYLRALPSRASRDFYTSVIQDVDLFPNNLIYRNQDPFFGKSTDIKFLFQAGIHPADLESYIIAMEHNHYNKKINFGEIKTAVALDTNFNVKYEVVYLEMVDNGMVNGDGPPISTDLTNIIKNGYIPFTGSDDEFKVAYPNSFQNMQREIENNIGYANQGAIPDWMTSRQPDGKVLGFTRGVVLAYTIPGASQLIAYRLRANNVQFNQIDFTVDRYELDNLLSANFDVAANAFVTSQETTFDRIPVGSTAYPIVATVNYAVKSAFNQINDMPVSLLLAGNGIDGIKTFKSGDTLIFAQQELYTGETAENDGWIDYMSLFDDIGFDNNNFDQSVVIPGYLENLLNSSVTNERSGVWRINITDENIVKLEFMQPINLGQAVYVLNGNSYSSTKLYYDPVVKSGHTVPDYSILASINTDSSSYTRFDGGSTRFIENRDTYAVPGTGDKYLKFPGKNVLQQELDYIEADEVLNPLINVTMPSPGYW